MPLRTRPFPHLLVVGALALVAAAALASSDVQITPGGKRTLVSKDLQGERWAITCEDDGTISGNVFRPEGGPAAFVWCTPTGDDGNPDPYARIITLDCYGADPCPAAPCSDQAWTLIATIPLEGSFCLPPLAAPTAVPTPVPTPVPTTSPTPTPNPTRTPGDSCCKHCSTGKPCGDSCISRNLTCHQPPGCAC